MVVSIKNQESSIKNVVFNKLKRKLGCVCVCVGWDFTYRTQENKEILCHERRSAVFIKLNGNPNVYIYSVNR